ncbi:hypothetical protein BgiMline_009907 [Biomphalaria glabrata]|nr:pre-mRNA-splicing factor 38B-like; partial [Biomphalaria glabrata]
MDNAMGTIRTFRLQIQCWILPLWIMLTLVSSQGVKEAAVLNECDRGVKRHHPSQANLYQIFTRKDYRKQWLDYACPEYMIFDPRTCECAETQRPTETQGQVAQRSSNKGQSLRQPSSRREAPVSTQYSDKGQVTSKENSRGRVREISAQQRSRGNENRQSVTWDKEDSRQDSRQESRPDSRQDSRQESRPDSRQESRPDSRQDSRQDNRQGNTPGKTDNWQRSQNQAQGRRWQKEEQDDDVQGNSRDSTPGWEKQERNSAGNEDNTSDKRDNSMDKPSAVRSKPEVTSGKLSSRSLKDTDSEWDRDNEVIPASPVITNSKVNGYDEPIRKQEGTSKKQNSWNADKGNTVTDTLGQRTSGGDCHLHRPSSEDPSHFERWADGKWLQEDCNWPFYTGLVWSQASCRCEWGPNRTHVTSVSADNVPATCLMMLKITFDGGNIVDESRHIWLNIKDKENAVVDSDKSAVGGKCGSFRGASIAIPYFKSNVLGATFHIGFMFKLCPGDPDTDIPLLHNDCIESPEPPGIVIVYQAWKKRVVISMRTMDSEELHSEYCVVENTQSQWVKLDIKYSDNLLEVAANSEICISSDKYAGPVATNNCPLTLLGEAFCGKLDEVVISRGCTQTYSGS